MPARLAIPRVACPAEDAGTVCRKAPPFQVLVVGDAELRYKDGQCEFDRPFSSGRPLLRWLLLVGSALAVDTQARRLNARARACRIPRFASLKSDEVNVRTGPGTRYPIDWVFKRKGMPVEIVAEYENFRKIRDWQGASGWVYQSLLTGKRSFIIPPRPPISTRRPAASAEVVAKLEPEVMGEIRSCQGDWCRVKVSGVSGWLERTEIWGVYKSEPIN